MYTTIRLKSSSSFSWLLISNAKKGRTTLVKNNARIIRNFSSTLPPLPSPPPSANDVVSNIVTTTMENADPIITTFAPSDLVVRALCSIHETTGLPWWLSIVSMTVLLRGSMFPLIIMSQIQGKRMSLAKPELEKVQLAMKDATTQAEKVTQATKLQSIYARYQLNPALMLIPMVATIPMFISFYFGISTMVTTFPSFKTGGALWFVDLTSPDATYGLPLLTAGTMLITAELGGEVKTEQTERIKNIMRFSAIAVFPLTMGFSQGLFVYFLSSNLFTITQNLALRQPRIKDFLINRHVVFPPTFSSSDNVTIPGAATTTTIKGSNNNNKADEEAVAAALFLKQNNEQLRQQTKKRREKMKNTINK